MFDKKSHPAPPSPLHTARSGPNKEGVRELEQVWNIEGALFRLYASHAPKTNYTLVRAYRFGVEEGRASMSNPYLHGDDSFVENLSEDLEDWAAFYDALQSLANSISRILHAVR